MPGPVGNREDDLSRPRERRGKDVVPVTKGVLRPVGEWPMPDLTWHPIAKQLYESLQTSGQSDFYQDSDVALAFSICDDLSYAKKSGKRSGQLLQTIYSAMERLLVTEGDRRRVRIELTEPEEKSDAAVLSIARMDEALESD